MQKGLKNLQKEAFSSIFHFHDLLETCQLFQHLIFESKTWWILNTKTTRLRDVWVPNSPNILTINLVLKLPPGTNKNSRHVVAMIPTEILNKPSFFLSTRRKQRFVLGFLGLPRGGVCLWLTSFPANRTSNLSGASRHWYTICRKLPVLSPLNIGHFCFQKEHLKSSKSPSCLAAWGKQLRPSLVWRIPPTFHSKGFFHLPWGDPQLKSAPIINSGESPALLDDEFEVPPQKLRLRTCCVFGNVNLQRDWSAWFFSNRQLNESSHSFSAEFRFFSRAISTWHKLMNWGSHETFVREKSCFAIITVKVGQLLANLGSSKHWSEKKNISILVSKKVAT